ncbi:PTR2-domain-containing protein [Xylona heveae TC161]|uniref:PTR2-domain-containing protein n=1 Tax=Xylona heveae (strain CBS 132557 / TC161) TaxID=1328760 RepID=A0A165FFW4_XYLHT|nr:PTR2-domain-containing protein [Xylona heveae TC161]KZF20928.1 PTR2-domain-containing protein [Xylona heveae TC161]
MASNNLPVQDILPAGSHDVTVATGPERSLDIQRGVPGSEVPSYNDEKASNTVVTYTDGEDELEEPTTEELATLRKVAGPVSKVAYTLCAVEFAERASYYGCSFVFYNFIEFPLPKGGNGSGAPPKGSEETAGALGRGLSTSSALVLLFSFLAYCIPILGGWIADTRLGRYKTICIGVAVCGIAHIIMVFGALPSVLKAGHGMAPFVISLLILAFGAGLFKSNIAPTVIDQIPNKKAHIRTLKSGERVIVDPESTIQNVMLTFYGLVNVGAFFALATTYAEKDVGYWLAYLLPGIIYFLLPILLVVAYKRTVKYPPQGSELGNVLRVIGMAIKKNGFWKIGRKGFLSAAKPSRINADGAIGKQVPWTDGFVDDVSRTLEACQIFLFFPVYNLNDGGIGSIQTSQGASMTTKGAPNDLLNNFNPLTIIVAVPILSYVVYPLLRRYNIKFGRITRITFGFILAAISSIIGAILQWRVYKTSPCGYYATNCQIGDGVSPISIWSQLPLYILGALSECFCNVTAYELAYARSPKHMKGLVMAIFLFMTAISSAIGEAVTPALNDPHLIWPFVGTGVAGIVLAIVFHWMYRHLNDDDFTRKPTEDELVQHADNVSSPSDLEKKESREGA